MNKMKFFMGFLLIAGVVFLFNRCAPVAVVEPNYDYGAVDDNGLAENMFEDAGDWSDMSMDDDGFKQLLADTVYKGQCVTALLDTTAHPKKLVIDFGTSNCLCTDNRYRRGKIVVTYYGGYFKEGAMIVHTFDNYYVNDNKIVGSRTTINKGRNLSGKMYWDVFVAGSIEKANGGGTISWNCNRTKTWTAGEGQAHANWEFELAGSATGIGSNGWTYSCNITQNLVKKASCKWIVSGIVDIFPRGYPKIELDYGSGACDNIVTATINGTSKTIELY